MESKVGSRVINVLHVANYIETDRKQMSQLVTFLRSSKRWALFNYDSVLHIVLARRKDNWLEEDKRQKGQLTALEVEIHLMNKVDEYRYLGDSLLYKEIKVPIHWVESDVWLDKVLEEIVYFVRGNQDIKIEQIKELIQIEEEINRTLVQIVPSGGEGLRQQLKEEIQKNYYKGPFANYIEKLLNIRVVEEFIVHAYQGMEYGYKYSTSIRDIESEYKKAFIYREFLFGKIETMREGD